MEPRLRDLVVGVGGAFLLLGGCSSEEAFGAECSDAWREACEEQGCTSGDPDWQECKFNGWSFTPTEHCSVNTGYPGDDRALCPLSEEEGYSFRYGPSSYDDVDEMARYLTEPQGEFEDCFYQDVGNAERFYFNRYAGRMRPQSHHLILRGMSGSSTVARGLGSCGRAQSDLSASFITGSQTPIIDYPDYLLPHSPDDDVTAQYLEADTLVSLNLHYVNRTQDTVLREGWVNLYRTDPANVQIAQSGIMLLGLSINLQPNTVGNKTRFSTLVPTNRKIVALTGHFHANGTRFSVWIQRQGSTEPELVYEMYDPIDPLAVAYRPGMENPEPNRSLNIGGGFSGNLEVQAGDRLIWECEMDNPTNAVVRFGNQAADQMCNLFGYYVADQDYGVWNTTAF